MPYPRIIAICGLKRSGKDTLADVISEVYGYKKIKIAESLKDMVKATFNFSDEQLETDAKDIIDDKWGITPREVLQFMGTDVMQYHIQSILPNIGRTFWIKKLIDNYIEVNPNQKYVISDMRFKHEYEALLPYSPFIIKVERKTATPSSHISETEHTQIPYDRVFCNDGQLCDVEDYVKSLFSQT